MKYYIGERVNPQLPKSYYIAYGRLSAKDAQKKEDSLYGNIYVTKYNTKAEYESEIESLIGQGFMVSNRDS